MHFLQFLCIDWANFWAALTAIATVFLVVVGYVQLGALNKTNKEGFLNNLKGEFFTDEARLLLFLIEQDSLVFEIEEFPKIDNAEKDELLIFRNGLAPRIQDFLESDWKNITKEIFTTNEVDDFLLQHLEDLGLLLKKRIINIYDADQAFGYYVISCFEYPAIQKYIEVARKDDPDIYSNFEYLYNQLPKPGKK